MKALLFVVSLAAVLIALPASAQLGPAGVPGAPGLAETDPSVKPGPPSSQGTPQAQQTQQKKYAAASCRQNKDATKCKGNKTLKKQRKDCSKSADPARCEQHKKAATLCKDKLGAEHRQCLHENLLQ